MRKLRLGLAQINSIVGDFSKNVEKMKEFIKEAESWGVDLICFPELAITGYPPEDLLLKPGFIKENLKALEEIILYTKGKKIACVTGFIDVLEDLYNALAVIYQGKIGGIYRKVYLSNYGAFDEERYFKAGSICPVFTIFGVKIGFSICEDIWYPQGPIAVMAQEGAKLIVNINASPYHVDKREFRERMLSVRASDFLVIVAYLNLVGGQDELVFDGNSLILNEEGEIIARGKAFEEDLVVVDLSFEEVFRSRLHDPRMRKRRFAKVEGLFPEKIVLEDSLSPSKKPPIERKLLRPLNLLEEVYSALVLGTRDYVRKNGFSKVVIGLSGGIDSSLVATIAVDALGKDSVVGVFMPSRYSSYESRRDAETLAKNLGIQFLVIPIDSTFQSYLDMLSSAFSGTEPGIAEENLQARIRGNILMALSNKFGWIVLTTGNKSEMACGYATLYGDMAGGFAVIKDVPKTMVYELARFRNEKEGKELIPKNVFEKPPSAELRPNQKDTDTLPPYEILDPLLKGYVEEDRSFEDLRASGFDDDTIKKVICMVDRNEYKRRQAPPGIKITPRAFGKDRCLPITNHFREKG